MNTLARKLLVPAFSQLTNVRISNYFKSIVFVESRKILCRGYNFPPPFIPVFRQAKKFLNKIAIADHNGKHSYKDVLVQSHHLAERIKATLGTQLVSKCQQRIAFLCPNSVSYVVALWATWQTNNIAVPLSKFHPPSQLTYYVIDSEAALVVVTPEFFDTVKPITDKLGIPLIILDSGCDLPDIQLDEIDEYNDILKNQNAMIIYTSGTTGSPKGVVLTHFNLHAQTSCLIQSWEWSSRDVILHALPLHHVHGIVNALLCPLLVGATCVMLPKFNPSEIWKHIVDAEESEPRVNIFMGVPTMYVKLIEEYDSKFCQAGTFSRTREFIKAVCIQKVRLMVSGSAALPQPVLERWEEITGHRLLERYGMTEIGMALSNPLHGKRIPGSVGNPLQGVEVRIAVRNVYSPTGYDIIVEGNIHRTYETKGREQEIGELLVRGPSVFKCYWNRPDVTASAFTTDEWFQTGDTAQYIDGAYKILGRTSYDIIKSGGYKISALEIERHLLAHPNIKDCAVVGLPDITWGEKVGAVIVLANKHDPLVLSDLRDWCRSRVAPYAIPSVLEYVPELPRNVMGKVNKKNLIKQVFTNIKKNDV
ncbi:acyl-CoA synthetase family member 3 isoform X1 [Tachypleus tridentatus]|uniref:acyl-CoA synthetase family member 3 isoform X1 n=1 Tax=Tachypleus tridentatus TaxID=6853 RepID=UPI003FD4AE05